MTLQALSVASEVFPLVKTGGLADVTGALPGALAREGVQTRTLVPGYPAVMAKISHGNSNTAVALRIRRPVRRSGNHPCLSVPQASTFSSSMLPISMPGPAIFISGLTDWTGRTTRRGSQRSGARAPTSDSARSRAFRQRPRARAGRQAALGCRPFCTSPKAPAQDISPPQSCFPGPFSDVVLSFALAAPGAFKIDGVEYFDGVGFLKAGLRLSDAVTTVSPTYASEIMTPEFGMGPMACCAPAPPSLRNPEWH